jgi:hypothetical protein
MPAGSGMSARVVAAFVTDSYSLLVVPAKAGTQTLRRLVLRSAGRLLSYQTSGGDYGFLLSQGRRE